MKTKQEIRIRDRERLIKWRTNMREEQREKLRKKNLLRIKVKYEKMTQTERDEYNKNKYKKSKESLLKMENSERELAKEKARINSKNYRNRLTKEEKQKRKEIENAKRRKAYESLTKEQKEIKRQKFSQWYAKNKKAYIKRMGKKNKERSKVDTAYRIKNICSSRLRKAIYAQGGTKTSRTVDLLGCSPNELRQHLEKQFDSNMTWENYGSYWHVDHIKPCSLFDLTKQEEQYKCFHYSNLQPLEAIANIKKSDTFNVALDINSSPSNHQ